MCLQEFFNKLEMFQNQKIIIFCDNIGDGKLSKNSVFHARTKHIDIKHHFVREVLERGTIETKFTPSEEMVADILTKGLTRDKHLWCIKELGLI